MLGQDSIVGALRTTILLAGSLAAVAQPAAVITTIAGTARTFPQGMILGKNAPLGHISGVAVDAANNVYAADADNNIVVKLTPAGTLTIVAGNGIAGFSGDGGPAQNASLIPGSLAFDPQGNLYITDGGANSRIRRLRPDGIIETYAGTGFVGPAGDGGPAKLAQFSPLAIAADGIGNLYIADQWSNNVRRINSNGIITTFAGGGTGFHEGAVATSVNLGYLVSLTADLAGNVYIGVALPLPKVYKVSSAGMITTYAGNGSYSGGDGGPAIMAGLYPAGLGVDRSSNLLIADTADVIHKVDGNGRISIIVGNGHAGFSGDGGPALSASFAFYRAAAGQSVSSTLGLATDFLGNLFVGDSGNYRVRRIASSGIVDTVMGSGLFSATGDGGPPGLATFNYPADLALDGNNNLYVADYNNRVVRKISADGTTTTVAGNHGPDPFQDDVPATASAVAPAGLAIATEGSVYIAEPDHASVKRIDPGGFLRSVAGNGQFGCAADGANALQSSLNSPSSVAIDSAGQLYIGDLSCHRVFMLTNGTLQVVAGNGATSTSGDNGPARGAGLGSVGPLTFDTAGNLYIADGTRIRRVDRNGVITTYAGGDPAAITYGANHVPAIGTWVTATAMKFDTTGTLYLVDSLLGLVRKITPDGIITTIAGTGNRGFSGDGGPALTANLFLNFSEVPTIPAAAGLVLDAAGDVIFTDTLNNRVRAILNSPPQVGAVASTVRLFSPSGGKAVTTTLTVAGFYQSLFGANGVLLQIPGLDYQVSTGGAAWLSVSPLSGMAPGLLSIKADPLALLADNYDATITITVPNGRPTTQTVDVQFTVSPGVPPAISIDQKHLSFTYATTSVARSQTIVLSNSGGGSLSFTTSISLNSGQSANWLSVAPASGTATPDNPVSMAVRANPSGLPLGTYTGSVTIQGGSAGSVKLPVTMTITTNPHVLLLSQTGLTFTAIQNGGAIPPQTFGVLNLGSGTLGWSVQTSTLAGGNWLNATPANGSSDAASPSGAPLVTVSVNPAGLQPDIYYGLVKVISNGAANTPQEVVVALRVLPAGIDLAPIVLPSSLIFTSPTGVSSPSSQNLLVYDPTGTHKSFRSAKATVNGGSWLVTLRGDATIAADQPASIVVQPIVNNLAAGVYTGTLTLEFSDGRVTAVPITFVVTGASGSSPPTGDSLPFYGLASTQTCTPSKLLPALTTLSAGFDVPANFPQQLIAQIVDDCGTPLTQGKVSVEFTTGQPIQYMDSLSNGRWDLTWQTAAQAVGVTLTVRAEHPTLPISGSIQITGGLGETKPPPLVNDNGVVSAASGLPTPVAPGGIITIYGSALSAGTGAAPVLPLPTLFNNTTVTLGDFALPLFYTSDGLLNALVPYGISTNTNMSLLVQRENSYADVVRLNVAAAQPEVFQYGMQQGIAVDLMGNLIGPSNPAHAAEALVVYCAGLGAVTPPVADGAAAGPSSTTTNQVIVTIDGKTANVASAGLTQGLPGLYQINLTVPQGVTPGDRVPVVVTAGGQTSSVVFFSVR